MNLETAEPVQPTRTAPSRVALKWIARLIGFAVVAIAYVGWKVVAEEYKLENAVMGTYRPVVLGGVYYLFWVVTRRIDGSTQPPAGQADENSRRLDAVDTVRYLLIVCLGIAAGFFAVQFVYVAAIDNSTSVNTAKVVSFVAFLVASGVVIKLLTKYFIPGLSRGLR